MHQQELWKRLAIGVGKWLIAAGVIGWLLVGGRLDLGRVAELWRAPWALLGGLALVVLNLWMTGWRFGLLLRQVDLPIAHAEAVRLSFIGHTMNMLTFGSASADLTRAVLVARTIGCGGGATAMVLVDRCTGLFGLVVMALVAVWAGGSSELYDGWLAGLLLGVEACWWAIVVWCWTGLRAFGRVPSWSWWLLALCLGSLQMVCHLGNEAPDAFLFASGLVALVGTVIGGLCLAMARRMHAVVARGDQQPSTRWRRLAAAAARTMAALHRRPVATVQAIALSVLAQAPLVIALLLIAAALKIEPAVSIWHVCLATPLAILSTTLPIPGAGIGVGEAAFDITLRRVTAGTVVAGATLFLAFRSLLVFVALLALPLVLRGGSDRRPQARGDSDGGETEETKGSE